MQQIPPAYSAVKIQGKKMYELARAGKRALVKPRTVHIHSIKLRRYEYPNVELEIVCGSGTYIRAIARDLGAKLGTGAYVQDLRREAIGTYTGKEAIALNDLTPKNLPGQLLPPKSLITHLSRITLAAEQALDFRHGKHISPPLFQGTGHMAVFTDAGTLLGVGNVSQNLLQPVKVLV
jgi:tRNA pseudouridine55 synthase